MPASVVFARRLDATDANLRAVPLVGEVERWQGKPGEDPDRQTRTAINATSVNKISPYASHSRQGAAIVPRCLSFVEETENLAIIQAGQTVTVNPRRGSQDKKPWRDLDLTALTGQTLEVQHVHEVHLGETVVPYATLDPLKAVLPLKRDEFAISADENGVGGIRIAGLEKRMRERWQIASELWEENKKPVNKLNLLGRLDFHRELSAQLEWRQELPSRPIRVVYNSSGTPTAALLCNDRTLVDYTLFWIACASDREAYYLLSVINSDALYEAVVPLMPKGQFGARHLQKQLWKLPIPEFDPAVPLHTAIADAGEAAATGAAQQLAELRATRPRLTVTIARRELRKWLRTSPEGKTVEDVVEELLRSVILGNSVRQCVRKEYYG